MRKTYMSIKLQDDRVLVKYEGKPSVLLHVVWSNLALSSRLVAALHLKHSLTFVYRIDLRAVLLRFSLFLI
jgi:hypothetical protein